MILYQVGALGSDVKINPTPAYIGLNVSHVTNLLLT